MKYSSVAENNRPDLRIRVKRRGKSSPVLMVTSKALHLMSCKTMYTGVLELLVSSRGVGRMKTGVISFLDK